MFSKKVQKKALNIIRSMPNGLKNVMKSGKTTRARARAFPKNNNKTKKIKKQTFDILRGMPMMKVKSAMKSGKPTGAFPRQPKSILRRYKRKVAFQRVVGKRKEKKLRGRSASKSITLSNSKNKRRRGSASSSQKSIK